MHVETVHGELCTSLHSSSLPEPTRTSLRGIMLRVYHKAHTIVVSVGVTHVIITADCIGHTRVCGYAAGCDVVLSSFMTIERAGTSV